jgi:DNA-binding PadR family transcriptional regulator
LPKPLLNEESKRLLVLRHVPFEGGKGFNEIWRALKRDGVGLSYSTLSGALKALVEEGYVEFRNVAGGGIPKRLYRKTSGGVEYELHLEGKTRVTGKSVKRIIKAKSAPTEYGQAIFSRFPFTFEIELSAEQIAGESEEALTRFVGDMGETLVHNMAEILNRAYTNFLSCLADGRSSEAVESLRRGLGFRLKLTYVFDGDRVKVDRVWSRLSTGEKELLEAGKSVLNPSYSEIMGAWLLSFLRPLNPEQLERFDLTRLEGWAELITEHGNQWRRVRGVPLLKKTRVYEYLKQLTSTGRLSIKPFKFNGATLEFNGMPEPKPHEFYAFLAGMFSSIKTFLEGESPEPSNPP